MKIQLIPFNGTRIPMFIFLLSFMLQVCMPTMLDAQVLILVDEIIGKADIESDPSEEPDVLLYPNPAQDVIHFQPDAGLQITQLHVFDSQGSWVATVDLSSGSGQVWLAPGVYAFSIFCQESPPFQKRVVITS